MRKRAAAWVGLVIALLVVLLPGTSTAATSSPALTQTGVVTAAQDTEQDAGGEADQGMQVFVRDGREPVPGVSVAVTQDGQEVGAGETDEDGRVLIGVPGPGEYTATVDVSTLPEGITLTADEITRDVRAGANAPAAFTVGEPGSGGGSSASTVTVDRALQLAANGLRFGLFIALAAIGLSLIFGTTGLTNFAHGELVTFGAIMGFAINATLGLPLLVAAPLTVIVCGLGGYFQDRLLWGQLRRRGTGLIAMMIVSIGLALALRYGFLFQFGGTSRFYTDYQSQAGISIGPISLRPADLVTMAVSALVLVLVAFALVRTKTGKATRAVADNPALASATGIDVDRVIRVVWTVGASLAGLAGIMLGLSQGINFQMGLQILLLVFAAVVLGGLGTAFGAIVGALVVGVLIEVSTLVVSPELKNVGALAVLIIILLVRPQGILGRAERVG